MKILFHYNYYLSLEKDAISLAVSVNGLSVEFQDYFLVVFVLAVYILWALSLPNELF